MSPDKRIKAWCPCCFESYTNICYQNSGPVVRIYCKKCRFVVGEPEAKEHGFNNIIDYWNHIGIYLPQE